MRSCLRIPIGASLKPEVLWCCGWPLCLPVPCVPAALLVPCALVCDVRFVCCIFLACHLLFIETQGCRGSAARLGVQACCTGAMESASELKVFDGLFGTSKCCPGGEPAASSTWCTRQRHWMVQPFLQSWSLRWCCVAGVLGKPRSSWSRRACRRGSSYFAKWAK